MKIDKFFLKYFSKVGKRQRFIISSLLLSFLILFSSFLTFSQARYFLIIIFLTTYFFVFFSILEGIDKIEWLMLFLLPVYFSLVFDAFYFLLPGRWLTRIPFVAIYTVSIYAILLSSNIFNVGVERSLQLFRAAFSVNFLYLVLTALLVFNLILSFKLGFFYNFILIFLLSFPLALQFLWTINPKVILEREIVKYTFLIALFVAEISLIFSFIPIQSTIFALFLTACFYSLAGLFQAYLEGRLFKERIREFIFVLIFVFVIVILSVRW